MGTVYLESLSPHRIEQKHLSGTLPLGLVMRIYAVPVFHAMLELAAC